ncbi:hypothetical protein D3C71_1970650 [compost metagenome]
MERLAGAVPVGKRPYADRGFLERVAGRRAGLAEVGAYLYRAAAAHSGDLLSVSGHQALEETPG